MSCIAGLIPLALGNALLCLLLRPSFVFFFFSVYSFLREKDSVQVGQGQREREEDTESEAGSRL